VVLDCPGRGAGLPEVRCWTCRHRPSGQQAPPSCKRGKPVLFFFFFSAVLKHFLLCQFGIKENDQFVYVPLIHNLSNGKTSCWEKGAAEPESASTAVGTNQLFAMLSVTPPPFFRRVVFLFCFIGLTEALFLPNRDRPCLKWGKPSSVSLVISSPRCPPSCCTTR